MVAMAVAVATLAQEAVVSVEDARVSAAVAMAAAEAMMAQEVSTSVEDVRVWVAVAMTAVTREPATARAVVEVVLMVDGAQVV